MPMTDGSPGISCIILCLKVKQSYNSLCSLITLFANGLPFTTHTCFSVAHDYFLGQKETAGMLFLRPSVECGFSPVAPSHFSRLNIY